MKFFFITFAIIAFIFATGECDFNMMRHSGYVGARKLMALEGSVENVAALSRKRRSTEIERLMDFNVLRKRQVFQFHPAKLHMF